MKKLIILGNRTEWCEKSLVKLRAHEGVYFSNNYLPVNEKIGKTLGKLHFSYTTNKYFKLPFKWLWYNSFIDNLGIKNDYTNEICVLVFDHNALGDECGFMKFVRKRYHNVKFVYIFTNIVRFTSATERGYVDKLNDWYDVVFAFDPADAEKYNFEYSPLIYDADFSGEEERSDNLNGSVFYLGQAKDRLEGLLSVYEKLNEYDIKCDFHIANVPESKIKYENDIVYNQYMTYSEAVKRIKNSSCLIDVIQGDSQGLTIKTCEAVCYDKKLITTNKHVTEYPFYDSRYIRVIETADDIDKDFFQNNVEVNYSQEGKNYFSADGFWNRLWNALACE